MIKKINTRCFRAATAVLAILIWLVGLHRAFSQSNIRPTLNTDEFTQRFFAAQVNENIDEEALESLYQLYLHPLDINRANSEELAALYLLSPPQINAILRHREEFGDFLSIYELQSIEELDLDIIRQILPFLEVKYHLSGKTLAAGIARASDHYFVLRNQQTIEKSQGFLEKKYLGSPQHLYARYRLSHPKDFQIGLIVEKDAGEKNYLDYYTFHAQIRDKGRLKNLVIGDYQMQFGQGLTTAAGFALGKSSEAIATTRRSSLGIRPYSSLVESGFFRGFAMTYQVQKIEITPFYSSLQKDANVNSEEISGNPNFGSILTSGYHRTQHELANAKQIKEQNIGFNLTYLFSKGQIGSILLKTTFDTDKQKAPYLYNQFDFEGKKNFVIGNYFTYNWQNMNFFGEAARSRSGGLGMLGGLVGAFGKQVEFALNFRNYQKDFHSFYANAFAEGSKNSNEKGIFWGLKYIPKKNLIFSAFFDKFQFPWLKYQIDAPSSGFDYLLKISYQFSKKSIIYAQFHEEHKSKNLPNNTTKFDIIHPTIRRNMIGNFDFALSKNLKFQSRIQMNTFQFKGFGISKGFAIIQDIEGNIKKSQIRTRLAYFNTNDYDSRIYAYENDVLYAVSMPVYYGKGLRTYGIYKHNISKNIDLWLRIARTQLLSGTSIGSGTELINLPHKTDFKIQIKYQF